MKSKTEYILVNMITDTGTVTSTRQKKLNIKKILQVEEMCVLKISVLLL